PVRNYGCVFSHNRSLTRQSRNQTGPLFDAETRRKRELTAEAQRRRETLWIDFGLPSGHALCPGFGRRGGRGMCQARVAGLSRKLELFSECGRGRINMGRNAHSRKYACQNDKNSTR